jgi:hypothetical protein
MAVLRVEIYLGEVDLCESGIRTCIDEGELCEGRDLATQQEGNNPREQSLSTTER